ncbi:MAG: hypothetical protein AAFV86_11085 [Pseudomonadota bacterium]
MAARKIYFLHIHKAAGSTIVRLAERNGRTLFPDHRNGNPFCDGQLIEFWNWPLARQQAWMTSGRFDFFANETAIGSEMPSPLLVDYITVLRDPIDRVHSHYVHERADLLRNPKRFQNTAKERVGDGDFASFVRDHCFETYWASNYIVKQFSDRNYRRAATEADLDLAIERVGKFACVMFLDRLAEDVHQLARLGFTDLDIDAARAGTRNGASAREALADSPEALAKLEAANALDMRFIDHCRRHAAHLSALAGSPVPA